MFLCRGTKSFASSPFSYYAARPVQVAAIKTQVALRNPSVISCSQVRHGGANNGSILCVPREMLQHTSGGSNKSKYVSHTWTACKSVSSFGSILPLSRRSAALNATDQLTLPNSFGADTRTIHLSTQKLLSSAVSNAANQKQANWTQREPGTEVPKSSQGDAEKPEPEEKQDKTKQLKRVFKEYGAVGVSFHVGISLISLGIFYIAVSSGINMTDVLSKLGFSETVLQSKMAAGTSTFVLAYAIHKLFAPFRISITLVSVPLIVRYLRKIGLFKSSQPRL